MALNPQRRSGGSVGAGRGGFVCDAPRGPVCADRAVGDVAALAKLERNGATAVFRRNEGIGESCHLIIVPWHTSHSAEP
jgi:hypothetical protein